MDALKPALPFGRRAPRESLTAPGAKGRGSLRIFSRSFSILVLVGSLLFLGTVGFHYIESWTWFQAFYGTLMPLAAIVQLFEAGAKHNSLALVAEVIIVVGGGALAFGGVVRHHCSLK